LKFKLYIVIFSTLLLATLCSPAAEAFSLKKFLLAPVTIPYNFAKDLAFEIAECIHLKRTL
jgi:hypothetical protein